MGLCSPNTHRPEIRSVSALMYGPRSWEWEMPLAPSARICRIRSSSGGGRAQTVLQSSAPSTIQGMAQPRAGAGEDEEKGHSDVLLPAPCPPPPVYPSLATMLGTAGSEGQVLLQPLPEAQGHTLALKPVRKGWLLAASPWEHTSTGSQSAPHLSLMPTRISAVPD